MTVSVSVVIRTRNEIRTLRRALATLRAQSLRGFEVVVVDNGSTDGTLELARAEADRVVEIQEFTHARSTNLGVASASGTFVYLTNGHAWPMRDDLLDTGVRLLEAEPGVAGVYGRCVPHVEPGLSNAVERLMGAAGSFTHRGGCALLDRYRPGMLQTQSAMIRRTLATRTPFREVPPGGGEDVLWAIEHLRLGLRIAYHPAFDVFHSHGGANLRALRRFRAYRRMISRAKACARELGIPPGSCY